MTLQTLIDTKTLAAHLDDPEWVIVDCRFELGDPEAGRRAYAAGHLPRALYADLDRDLSGPVGPHTGRHPLPDPEKLARTFGAWGIGAGRQVVAYDGGPGSFAARLWWLLRWLGHAEVAVLDGGFARWRAESRLVTTARVEPSPVTFNGQADRTAWVDAATVESMVRQRGRGRVIDARARKRFQGVEEPIDPVAGHVPGAVDLPSMENLGANGTFLKPADLRRRFEAALEGSRPAEVVHMCGSGVTACHNLLAMEVAGLKGSRLYPGSWSEWIRDPRRPVAQGDDSSNADGNSPPSP